MSQRTGRNRTLSPDALRALIAFDWPGNVRELENALEYAATVARGQTLQQMDLPRETGAGVRAADEAREIGRAHV